MIGVDARVNAEDVSDVSSSIRELLLNVPKRVASSLYFEQNIYSRFILGKTDVVFVSLTPFGTDIGRE